MRTIWLAALLLAPALVHAVPQASRVPFMHGLKCSYRAEYGSLNQTLELSWQDDTPRVIITYFDLFGTPSSNAPYPISHVQTDPVSKTAILFVAQDAPVGCETGSGLLDGLYVSRPADPVAFERGESTTTAALYTCDTQDWFRYGTWFDCRTAGL